MEIELLIGNEKGTKVYRPAAEEEIEWSTERRSTPGKLSFKVLSDKKLDISEGSPVRLKVNGDKIFFGFIFKQQRSKKEGKVWEVAVTAYDQLRYLKNKDTKVYENKTADQFVKMVADDYQLCTGKLENTKYVIPSRVEENTSLFEMIENALDLTLQNKKEMYVLYDDFGKLTLKNISNMYVRKKEKYLLIDADTGENFDYVSSVDDNTYNRIKLAYDNESSGKRDIYIAQDSSNMNRWGILQYFDTLQKGENGKAKADALLKLYNQKTRNLSISKAAGDNRVRAGSLVLVNINLGDKKVKNFMLVEKCKHIYKGNEHWMDLTLRGGEFIA
ncbi:MAG: hydrolase [Lachnospiraceae bacterium]|nr:hydrolase [Lachnospiraceae bacterium]